jgi:hypothetical protein
MRSRLDRKLALAMVAVVLLGGTAAAVAATRGTKHGSPARQEYLDDVAKHLGVSPSALTAAMKAAATERVQSALAAGRITPTQAKALEARIQQSAAAPFLGPRPGGGRARMGVAARYLGISAATLRNDRRAGKSLAEIAAATPGKSVAGLQAALTAAAQARIAAATASGRITAAQAKRRSSRLSHNIEALLQRKGRAHHGPASSAKTS